MSYFVNATKCCTYSLIQGDLLKIEAVFFREPMDDNDLHNRVERQQLLVSGLKENEARFDHIFVLGKGPASKDSHIPSTHCI